MSPDDVASVIKSAEVSDTDSLLVDEENATLTVSDADDSDTVDAFDDVGVDNDSVASLLPDDDTVIDAAASDLTTSERAPVLPSPTVKSPRTAVLPDDRLTLKRVLEPAVSRTLDKLPSRPRLTELLPSFSVKVDERPEGASRDIDASPVPPAKRVADAEAADDSIVNVLILSVDLTFASRRP
jgi:hypothetical protein